MAIPKMFICISIYNMEKIQGNIHSIETCGTVDGPGTRFVVFTKGCPMRCQYCHNPDTWEMTGATDMEPKYILEQYHRNESFYQNGGGITVTGGEPTVQIDFLLELFELCKKDGIHTCLDTSGIMFNPDNAELMKKYDRLCELTDLVMLDIKHIDNEHHKVLCAQPNTNILKFPFYLQEKNVDMWIRHVIVPGLTDDDKYLYELGYYIGQFHNLRALDALPYHDMGKKKYEELGIDYPLKDTKPLDPKVLLEKKKIILDGVKKRREELTAAGEDFSHK